jgi:hypothetical protein
MAANTRSRDKAQDHQDQPQPPEAKPEPYALVEGVEVHIPV